MSGCLAIRLEHRAVREFSLFDVLPQRHHQFASQRHDANSAQSPAPRGKAFLVPLRQRALGLVLQPQPGQFDAQRTQAAAAGFAQPLVAVVTAAGEEPKGSGLISPFES